MLSRQIHILSHVSWLQITQLRINGRHEIIQFFHRLELLVTNAKQNKIRSHTSYLNIFNKLVLNLVLAVNTKINRGDFLLSA
jgi:hypothetical protein